MELKNRILTYYPLQSNYIIEKDLDEFIGFFIATGNNNGKKCWHSKKEICDFFIPKNNLDFFDVKVEYENLITELIEFELIKQKSARTYYLGDGLYDKNILDTKNAYKTIMDISRNELGKPSYIYYRLAETCVFNKRKDGSYFICWHENKFFPNATVDKLKELSWNEFYALNKDNSRKRLEYFKSLQA